MKLRKYSLLIAAVGALILTGFIAPKANATLIVYFNFEDAVSGGAPDLKADTIGAPDLNPGGGLQGPTAVLTYGAGDFNSGGGLLLNRTTLDSDPAAPVLPSFFGQALVLNNTAANQGSSFCFTIDTSHLTDLSLSFAVDNNGNGFDTVQLTYTINGGTTMSAGTQPMGLSSTSLVTFSSIGAADFTGPGTTQNTEFCLIFTGSNTSSGQNRQTAIDNIQLSATVVPEPSTYIGGLLGIAGLCWYQRRSFTRFLRLRRA